MYSFFGWWKRLREIKLVSWNFGFLRLTYRLNSARTRDVDKVKPSVKVGTHQDSLKRRYREMMKRMIFLVVIAIGLICLPNESRGAPFAYITNYGDDTVSVIDTETDTVTDTVAVGSGPTGVAVNSGGTRVYVTNRLEDTVSVIDTSTNTVVDTVTVEDQPRGVAVHPAGTFAYVTNRVVDSVSVIETTTNTVIASVPVGDHPSYLAFDPVGTFAYVANTRSDTVSVIDTATNTEIDAVPVGDGPMAVAVHPAGTHVYVTNYLNDTLSIIDTATNTVVDTVAVGNNPRGVAVHPAGTRIYVANKSDNTVSIIDTATNTEIDTVVVGNLPYALGNFIGPPQDIIVDIDIKPASCPNPLNVKSKGVLPVAIVTTENFDASQVDPASVLLAGVSPLRWDWEDVATPFEPYIGKEDCYECTDQGGADGWTDLTLKFDTQEVVEALGDVEDGECVVLELCGTLLEDFGGIPIVGEDVVLIKKKGKK